MDQVTRERLIKIYPELKVLWLRVAEDMRLSHRCEMRVAVGLRSLAEQEALYAQGRTKPGPIVTWAQPGDSLHLYGLAIDSCFLKVGNIRVNPFLEGHPNAEELWREYARFAEAHGFVAGANWRVNKDRPHIERAYGLKLPEIKELYRNGGLTGVWTQIDQIRGVKAEWYGPQPLPEEVNG